MAAVAERREVDMAEAGGPGNDDIKVVKVATIDEDDSSLSSTGTEIFDHGSGQIGNATSPWRISLSGNVRRYGSSESAPDTGMSSVSSSLSTGDKYTTDTPTNRSPQKRRSDGSDPRPTKRLSTGAKVTLHLGNSSSSSSATTTVPLISGTPHRPKRVTNQDISPTGFSPKVRRASRIIKQNSDVRPKSSIPSKLPAEKYANQCITAAHASRLNPYALHTGEYRVLRDHIAQQDVTTYLNIRNGILRLWTKNPLVAVTSEEAAGCAKEARFFELAYTAYRWLVRNGYINFGCVEVPRDLDSVVRSKKSVRQKTIVVIGAGVSGLASARQLEGLFAQSSGDWTDKGEKPPRVVVLEGRNRIGGRVYSQPLRSQVTGSLPGGLRNTAEMGAMIVTGFDHGNPLDSIIRGQLGLRYHLMKDALTIYDFDGRPVDHRRDTLNTDLYTDISDRVGAYRAKAPAVLTLHGDAELIDRCRDPLPVGVVPSPIEGIFGGQQVTKKSQPSTKRGRRRNAPPGHEKLTGRSQVVEGNSATKTAGRAASMMGWQLREGVTKHQSVALDAVSAERAQPTLGSVMDEAIWQYQGLVDLTSQDMRLLNWHHANLEYANAATVSQLSLSGHDQDTGNEFEGAHSEIIGGYTQLPRGLMNLPTKLDVRFQKVVQSVQYSQNGQSLAKVTCADGEVIEADEVVLTSPLGVLKAGTIAFDPPLPGWKKGAIQRMGFGLLNKVVLLYDYVFWDNDRDMFGLLNEAERRSSLNPADYERRRGRFYLIWNCSKMSGRPMLIALMAGNAAYQAEVTHTNTLVNEITDRLARTFTPKYVPAPTEAIVTRWKKDPFTRGTYSYVSPQTDPGDYDLMAKSVGNLHFAGEATCGTHPATVHGAFLSGLRVAADIVDTMAGPIAVSETLVAPAPAPAPLPAPASVPMSMPVSGAVPVGVPAHFEPTAVVPKRRGRPPKSAKRQAAPPSAGSSGPPRPFYSKGAPVVKQEPIAVDLANVPPSLPQFPKETPTAGSSYAHFSTDDSYEAAIIGTILSQIGERPIKPNRYAGVNPFLLYTKDKWEECKAWCTEQRKAAGAVDTQSGRNEVRRTLGVWWGAAAQDAKEPYLVQAQNAQDLAAAVRAEYEKKAYKWDCDAMRIRQEYVNKNPAPLSSRSALEGGFTKRKTNVSGAIALDGV